MGSQELLAESFDRLINVKVARLEGEPLLQRKQNPLFSMRRKVFL